MEIWKIKLKIWKYFFKDFINEKREFYDVDNDNPDIVEFTQEIQLKTEYYSNFHFIIVPNTKYKLYNIRSKVDDPESKFKNFKMLQGKLKRSDNNEVEYSTVTLRPYDVVKLENM